MALDQSALLEVLEMLKAAPDVGTGAANDVTHSSRIEGSGAAAVDRFVDRAICATSALRAIGGTAPGSERRRRGVGGNCLPDH